MLVFRHPTYRAILMLIYCHPVPTGLLGLQGDDPSGMLIRKTMKNLNVSTKFVQGKKCR